MTDYVLDETHLKIFTDALTFFLKRLQCFDWEAESTLTDDELGMSFQLDPREHKARFGLSRKQKQPMSDDDICGLAYKAVLEMIFARLYILITTEGTPPWAMVGELKSIVGKLEQSYPDSKFAAKLGGQN